MDESTVSQVMGETLVIILYLSLPALGLAAGIGLLVGLIQAVTQIQDQTLPIAIKVISIVVLLVLLGPTISAPLLQHAQELFNEFPRLTGQY